MGTVEEEGGGRKKASQTFQEKKRQCQWVSETQAPVHHGQEHMRPLHGELH